jgi:heterodisulfide reductase subunit A
MGLAQRSSIYVPFPQAIPKVATIDPNTCMHILGGVCQACTSFCEANAIDFTQQDEIQGIEVGAAILAPGFEQFDPNLKKELGYGRYPNVVSSLQFERILSASGPYLGSVLRPSDRRAPSKIAWIQCVGSREAGRDYCSSVCCMYATKEAIIAKEHEPDLDCTIFFIDLRAFGKGFDEYYNRARELGINAWLRSSTWSCSPPVCDHPSKPRSSPTRSGSSWTRTALQQPRIWRPSRPRGRASSSAAPSPDPRTFPRP